MSSSGSPETSAIITIDRPEVRNSFRPKTTFELIDAFSRGHSGDLDEFGERLQVLVDLSGRDAQGGRGLGEGHPPFAHGGGDVACLDGGTQLPISKVGRQQGQHRRGEHVGPAAVP